MIKWHYEYHAKPIVSLQTKIEIEELDGNKVAEIVKYNRQLPDKLRWYDYFRGFFYKAPIVGFSGTNYQYHNHDNSILRSSKILNFISKKEYYFFCRKYYLKVMF